MTLFCIEEVSFHERDVHLRLPFRFGVATLTSCPQVHVLVKVKFSDGSVFVGCSAEMMVPKWFDKNTALSNEDNFEQLRTALRVTRSAYLSDKKTKQLGNISLIITMPFWGHAMPKTSMP